MKVKTGKRFSHIKLALVRVLQGGHLTNLTFKFHIQLRITEPEITDKLFSIFSLNILIVI